MMRTTRTYEQALRSGPLFAWGAVALIVAMMWPRIEQAWDSRTMRDLRGVTPFRSVKYEIIAVTGREMYLSGTLIKTTSKCVTVGMPTVVTVKDGIANYGYFSSLENRAVPESRPALKAPQAFGIWVLHSLTDNPDKAVMLRTHDCGGEIQTNMVLSADWNMKVGPK